MRCSGWFLAAAIVFATPLAAETYICEVEEVGQSNWVPAQLVIQHKAGDKTAIVNDPIILTFAKQPLTAKVTRDTDKDIVFDWIVRNVVNGVAKQKAKRFHYRATLTKGSLAVKVTARPEDYDNSFVGRGTCKVK